MRCAKRRKLLKRLDPLCRNQRSWALGETRCWASRPTTQTNCKFLKRRRYLQPKDPGGWYEGFDVGWTAISIGYVQVLLYLGVDDQSVNRRCCADQNSKNMPSVMPEILVELQVVLLGRKRALSK